jgi:hypothetical protein
LLFQLKQRRLFPRHNQYLEHCPVQGELLWLFGVKLFQLLILVFEKEQEDESKDFLLLDQLFLEELPKIQDLSSI